MTRARHRKPRSEPGRGGNHDGGFRAVLAIREFRVLWLADLQSSIGDQLARVALSVLVYRSTGSGFLTAGVYALTFLPALLGSVLLGHLADRLPKRALLVGGDLIRAALLAAMALPQVPLWAVTPLLVVAVVVGTPWQAAESALVSEILSGERYVMGVGLRSASSQGAQLVGFGVGGVAVAVLGPHGALAVDAGTFALSALLIAVGVRRRRRPAVSARDAAVKQSWSAGARIALGTRQRRLLLGLAWLCGVIVVPEGLAVPYAHAIGGGATTAGLILSAMPAGVLIGSIVYSRFMPTDLRIRAVGVMAMLACVPLLSLYTEPGLAVALPLLAISGFASAYQTQVVPEFVTSIDVARRGQAIALASAGLLAAQGLGLLVGGVIAQVWSAGPAIAVCGAAGVVLAWRLTIGRAKDLRQRRRMDLQEGERAATRPRLEDAPTASTLVSTPTSVDVDAIIKTVGLDSDRRANGWANSDPFGHAEGAASPVPAG